MKFSVLTAAMLGTLLTASSSFAQGHRPAPMRCPHPTVQSLQMGTPVVVNADFTAAALAAPRAGVNDPAANKIFLHTFRWDPPACCQITAARLTVTMRANQTGASAISNDAGNDTVGIALNGVSIPGMVGLVYTAPVTLNQQVTRTFVVNAAGLAAMNANHRLSFAVQDDTRVLSAGLRIERCCVNMRR